MIIELGYAILAPICAALLIRRSNRGSDVFVVTPIVAYTGIEVFAVWYALSPFSSLADDFSLFVIASFGIIALAAGFVVTELVTGRRFSSAAVRSLAWDRPLPVGLPIVVLATVLSALAMLSLGGVPRVDRLFAALLNPAAGQDTLIEVGSVRRSGKSHFFGGTYTGQGLQRVLLDVGWQYLIALAWVVYWRRGGQNLRKLAVFVTLLALTFLTGAGVRSSILFLFVVLIIARTLVADVNLSRMGRYALLGFAVMVLIAPLSKGVRGNEDLVTRIGTSFDRLARGNSTNNVAIVELIGTGELELGRGAVLRERFTAILPGVGGIDRPFANRLAILMGGSTNSTTYATPTQLGIWYADFKAVGVVIGYFITGSILAIAGSVLTKSTQLRTEYQVAFQATAVFTLGYWAISGPSGVLANLLVLVAIHLSVRFFASVVRREQFGFPSRVGHPVELADA